MVQIKISTQVESETYVNGPKVSQGTDESGEGIFNRIHTFSMLLELWTVKLRLT
jgi:hypothetical protein